MRQGLSPCPVMLFCIAMGWSLDHSPGLSQAHVQPSVPVSLCLELRHVQPGLPRPMILLDMTWRSRSQFSCSGIQHVTLFGNELPPTHPKTVSPPAHMACRMQCCGQALLHILQCVHPHCIVVVCVRVFQGLAPRFAYGRVRCGKQCITCKRTH